MSTVLQDIIVEPPGTWLNPSLFDRGEYSTSAGEIARWSQVARSPHTPVTKVVAVTPVNVGAGDVVKAESWYLPVVSGSVRWDQTRYPQGAARLEVAASGFEPGPPPNPPYAVDPHPTDPTLSPEGVPWCLLPFGTIVSVYRGWMDPSGAEGGIKVFDGIITRSSYDRPGRTWRVEAADLSIMLERVSWRYNLTLSELMLNSDAPTPGSANDWTLSDALTAMLREASEFWWPLDNNQLPYDDPGVFDPQTFEAGLQTADRVAGDEVIGGRDAWGLAEQWCDAAGLELYMMPGQRGKVKLAEPRAVITDVPDDDRFTTVDRGDGGVLIGYDTVFTPKVNRVYYTHHARVDADTVNLRGLAPDVSQVDSTDAVQVRVDGMTVEVTVNKESAFSDQVLVSWDMDASYYNNPDQGSVPWYQDYLSPNDADPNQNSNGGSRNAWPITIEHTYPLPGTYKIGIHSGSWNVWNPIPDTGVYWEFEIEARVNGELLSTGFANRFNITSPLGVRRTGRVAWVGDKEKSIGRMQSASAATEERMDEIAEKMFQRVSGTARENTLRIVPLPWLMPRHTINVDMGDGIRTERHMVQSVDLPLEAGQPMLVTTVNDALGSPAAGSPRLNFTNKVITGNQVTLDAVVRNGTYLQVAWGDASGKETFDNTAGDSPWTVNLSHTYSGPGTYKITGWTDDGVFERAQAEVI